MFYVISWIIFGALAGFIAAKIVNAHGEGCIVNAVLGIVGAVVGGAIFRFLGAGAGGFFWSLFVAVIGAIVVLFLWQAITGKRTLR